MTTRRVELVVTAAPLAERAHLIASDLASSGWLVSATTSLNAQGWVDAEALAQVCAAKPARAPGEPRLGPPSATVAIPATFNTLNKLRAGISDTPALGVLNDSVGQRLPLLVVPMVSERLIDHPAWADTVTWLGSLRVSIMDARTGQIGSVEPIPSGAGPEIAARFQPGWVTGWMASLSGERD